MFKKKDGICLFLFPFILSKAGAMGCTLAGPFLYEDELPFNNKCRGSQDEREYMNARPWVFPYTQWETIGRLNMWFLANR